MPASYDPEERGGSYSQSGLARLNSVSKVSYLFGGSTDNNESRMHKMHRLCHSGSKAVHYHKAA